MKKIVAAFVICYATAASAASLWDHNGSVVALEADGSSRKFYYSVPRSGLAVTSGTLLFKGTRNGYNYSGTAYVFRSNCRPRGYPVSGTVAADQRSVTMYGKAPRRDARCNVVGYRDDVLVFTFREERRARGVDQNCRERFLVAETFWRRLGYEFEGCTTKNWFILRETKYQESCLLLNPSLNFSYRKRVEVYEGVELLVISTLAFHRLVPAKNTGLELPESGLEMTDNSAVKLQVWIDREIVDLQGINKAMMAGAYRQRALDILIAGTPQSFDQQLAAGDVMAVRLVNGSSESLWIFGLRGSREALTWMLSCAGMGE